MVSIKYILSFVAAILFFLPKAEAIEEEFPESIDLVNKMMIYCGDKDVESHLEVVLRKSEHITSFTSLQDCTSEVISNKDYYLLVTIDTISEGLENYLLMVDPSATDITLWYINTDNLIQKERSGTFVAVKDRSFTPEVFKNIFKIDYNPQFPHFLLKIKSEINSVSPKFDVQLINEDHYRGNLITRKVWNGFLYGFIALISLQGFILFFFLKDYAYFFYGLLTSLAIVSITYINRDLADFVMFKWESLSPKYIYFTKLFVYGFAVTYMVFLRYATRSNITFDKWRKITYWIIMIAIPFVILEIVLGIHTNYDPNVTILLLNNYMIIVSLTTLIFAAQTIWRRQRRYMLFAIGIIFTAAGILLTGLIRVNSWIFSSLFFRTGVALEIVFFSFGLAYNYYLLNKEGILEEISTTNSFTQKMQSDKILALFYNYVKKNINKPELSIDDICRHLSISKAKLYRRMKRETNLTPIQIVNQLKMEEGMKLLKTTRLNVSEIAYELGYSDPNYFTRRFTKFYGNPPSQFKIN